MGSPPRSLVPAAPCVRPDAGGGVAEAEARLAAVLAEVTALDADVEELSGKLAEFTRSYEQLLAEPFAEVDAEERLVRRLQALEDEAARLASLFRSPAPEPQHGRRTARPRRAPPPSPPAEPEAPCGTAAAAEAEPDEVALKRVHRRLARLLHPDFARDEPERARLGELMAKVNAAYAHGDLAALEVMAEKLGAGEPIGEVSDGERRAHIDRRVAVLSRIAQSLARDRERMRSSQTFRLLEEASRRRERGGDYFSETRAELAAEARAASADARARLDRLHRAAGVLSRARSAAMGNLVHVSRSGGLRRFDPLSESALVRRGVLHLERQRATPAARDLARSLEEAAERSPWEVALTLLAFFAEAAGRAPDALDSPESFRDRYDALRAGWAGAPDFDRLLARLPRHLEVGMRAHREHVAAGVQVRSPDLVTGVRIALGRDGVARLARRVLETLGPGERCGSCREEVYLVHLMRTRGLDELNGLVCPRCGDVRRSYWRYGEVEGLEALQPFALELGMVAEHVVRFAGTAVGFQLLPFERDRLTAGGLSARFHELYFEAYDVDVSPEAVRLETAAGPLPQGARVPGSEAIRVVLDPTASLSEDEALDRLRSRIERRFRPDADALSR